MGTVRTNVMLPTDLLKEIDHVAGARRRSAFLTEAAREKLARLRFDRAATRAFGAWRDQEHSDLMTLANVKRFLRGIREITNRRMQKRAGRG